MRHERKDPQSGTWVEGDEPGTCLQIRQVRLAVLDGPDAGESVAFGKSPMGVDLILTV